MIAKSLIALLLFISLVNFSKADSKKYYLNVYFNDADKIEFIEVASEAGTDYVRFTLSGAFIGYSGKNTSYNIKITYNNGKDMCQLQSAYVDDVKIEIFSVFNRVDNIKVGENSYDFKYMFDEFESIRSGVKTFSYKMGNKGYHDFKNDFPEINAYRVSYSKL